MSPLKMQKICGVFSCTRRGKKYQIQIRKLKMAHYVSHQYSTYPFFPWLRTSRSSGNDPKISSIKIKVIKSLPDFLLHFKGLICILLGSWRISSNAMKSIKKKAAGKKKKSWDDKCHVACQALEFCCGVTVLACWQHDGGAWWLASLTWQHWKMP